MDKLKLKRVQYVIKPGDEDIMNKTKLKHIQCVVKPGSSIDPILNNNDWETISAVSQRGKAENYWSVGDTKQITLNGTIGDTPFNNVQLDVFILGFNHNASIEGNGITFGGFFHDQKGIALSSIHGTNPSSSGAKWFNINHSGESTTGGWKGCDMRYDILGSVEAKNQQNATSVAKTNPVANTLMAALPADFRSVIKPVTKWTDNVGGGQWKCLK